MLFLTNSDFAADISDVARQFFPNDKTEKTESNTDFRLGFFVEHEKGLDKFTCIFDGHKTTSVCEIKSEWSDIEKKRFTKRAAKLCAYKCFWESTGKTMPWGALTGIRPTKLAYELEKEGVNDVEKYFKNIFFVSDKKAEMVSEILKNQQGLINQDEKNADFYINIPFCVSRCSYCSFVSGEIAKQRKYVEPYIKALKKEIEATFQMACEAGYNIRNLYMGGGTPTSFSADELKEIFDSVLFDVSEFTIEAGRPDTIDKDKLTLFKERKVNRISINPQTFNQCTLDLINRKHTITDIYDKFELSRAFGFDINMDLIAGLPGESYEMFCDSVKKAVELKPDNITVHTLALKAGSFLKENSCVREECSDISKMLDFSSEVLKSSGYGPYYMYRQKYMAGNFENVGYSIAGKQCVYNIDMMEETSSIFACGANAVSKRVFFSQNRIERFGDVKDFDNYINRIDEMIDKKRRFFGL